MQKDKAENDEQVKLHKIRVKNLLMMFAMFAFAFLAIANMAQPAKADMGTDFQNFSWIISNFTTFFTNAMSVFMQPPLVYYVGLGFFVTFLGLAGGFLMRRKRRR